MELGIASLNGNGVGGAFIYLSIEVDGTKGLDRLVYFKLLFDVQNAKRKPLSSILLLSLVLLIWLRLPFLLHLQLLHNVLLYTELFNLHQFEASHDLVRGRYRNHSPKPPLH